ncbi:MAG: hypothetical protein V1775_05875 [Bacteroidota bacterium]
MEEFHEIQNEDQGPIATGVTDEENNPDEIELVVRRKEVLNTVLGKLIDKINEPIKEDKQIKHRFKQPKKK